MKKVFISQPMNGLPDEEIMLRRKDAEKVVQELIPETVEFIDSFLEELPPPGASPLWYLGESLKLLSIADIAYFSPGWKDARGCRIEHLCAEEYGMEIIEKSSIFDLSLSEDKPC